MKKRIIRFILTLLLITTLIPANIQLAYAASGSNYGYTVQINELSAKAGYVDIKGSITTSAGDATRVTVNVYIDGSYKTESGGSGKKYNFSFSFPLSAGSHSVSFGGYYTTSSSPYNNTQRGGIYSTSFTITKPTATLDSQGGLGGSTSATVNYGSANPSITVPTKTGYDFNGYYTGSGGTGTKYWNANGTSAKNWNEKGGKTLYAYWTPHVYNVTLNSECDYIKTVGASTVEATYDSDMPAITDLPERYGYTFTGYYTATKGGTKYYNADGTSAKSWDLAEATTLYAQWMPNDYTIQYYDGNSEITEQTDAKINDESYKTSFTCEEAVKLPVSVTKSNAIFNGWYDNTKLTGSPVYQWFAHDKTENQVFYAKWITTTGTRADSEKQMFDASIFDSPETSNYFTAGVTVMLDATPTNVGRVQLKQAGNSTITMSGTNGEYSYTTSEDVTGSWDIWVNGADSGENLTFTTSTNIHPTVVYMVTTRVTVHNNDTGSSGRNVILKTEGHDNLTLSESDILGDYALQTFATNTDYQVYVDGENTGKTVNLQNKNMAKSTIEYYTASVITRRDGTNKHMGAVELRNENTMLTLTGSGGSYSITKMATTTDFDVYVDGTDTGKNIKFSTGKYAAVIDYHTVTVQTQKDTVLSTIGSVTLRDNDGVVKYILTPSAVGEFATVSQESDTVYQIYVGQDNTGITASFTDSGKSPDSVNYYTVTVNTTKDSVACNMGTVLLKNGSQAIALSNTSTGTYALTKLATNTSFGVFVGGEDVGKTVRFGNNRIAKVDYKTTSVTVKHNDTASGTESVVLKASDTNLPDIAMNYDSGSQEYTAVTFRVGTYGVYVGDIYCGETSIGSDITLDFYTLRFDENGGQGNVPADKDYLSGTTASVLTEILTNSDGSIFMGWDANADGQPDYIPDSKGNFDITIDSGNHYLKAVWASDGDYEVRYRSVLELNNWSYGTVKSVMAYAASHSSNCFVAELCKDASLDGGIVSNNVSLTIASGTSLSGDFTNNGYIENRGTITGTVTNNGTINGCGIVNADDTITDAGTIGAIINQNDGTVMCSRLTQVISNAGTLQNCRIDAGTNVGGTIKGTIYACDGVTFESSVTTRTYENSTLQTTVISLQGGGIIDGSGDMNNADAFAGLMIDMIGNSGHYIANGSVHLRAKLAVNDPAIYANFFDFSAGSVVSGENVFTYNKQPQSAIITNTRTPGVGTITDIYYKSASEIDWTTDAPTIPGTYQVKANVSEGDYYYSGSNITDETVWTFTIAPKPAEFTWETATNLVYDKTSKLLKASVNNLEDGDVCTVTATLTDLADNVNAGSFTFTATALSNSYYCLPDGMNKISPEYTIEPAELTITVNPKSKYVGQPDPILDGTISGLLAGDNSDSVSYMRNTDDVSKENVGDDITITASCTDTNYSATVITAKLTITEKEVQTLSFASPTVITKYSETIGDNILSGAITDVSYVVDSGEAVTVDATTGAVSIVKVGNAVIKAIATETDVYAKAEAVYNITVQKDNGPQAPDVSFNFDGTNANKIMGATSAMEYSCDGITWTSCTDDMMISILDACTLFVRIKTTETTEAGSAQNIIITKEEMPSGIGSTPCTNVGTTDGTIIGVNTTMEYKSDEDATWTDVTESTITGLSEGTYQVRIKATGHVAASDAVSIKVATTYVVTFDAMGGSAVAAKNVVSGEKLEKPSDPTRNNSAFSGWYLNGEKYDFERMVTGSFTLTARWILNETESGKETTFETDYNHNHTTTSVQVTGDNGVKVSGLEDIAVKLKASNTNVDIKLVLNAEKKAERKITQTDVIAIKEVATDKIFDFITIDLTKYVGTASVPITDTDGNVIEVLIPFDARNKIEIAAYRYHEGSVLTFTESHLGTDGTFYIEGSGKDAVAHLFTTKFSTYAVGYRVSYGGDVYVTGHTITSDLDTIRKVTVDGKTIDSSNYTVSGGNIVLTQNYLNTLSNGRHVVKLYSDNQVATATITINNNTVVKSASTGDMGIALYEVLAITSMIGTGIIFNRKRKKV